MPADFLRLSRLLERLHASLTGVTAAQHHAKYLNTEAVAAVEAAGLALADGKDIKIEESLGTDHTWAGITCDGVADVNLVFGEVCYMKADGDFAKALATTAGTTMPAMAIALEDILATESGKFLLIGFIRDDTWSALTVGGLMYVDPNTAGDMTQTIGDFDAAGDLVQVLGIATTAVIIWFNPSYELVEIA